MLRTHQCPGLVSGWLLTFLWPLAIVGAIIAIHSVLESSSELNDGIVWGFVVLVIGAAIARPLHEALKSFDLWLARWLHPQNPYGCPCCGHDIHTSPHRCPECGTRLMWGELPDPLK